MLRYLNFRIKFSLDFFLIMLLTEKYLVSRRHFYWDGSYVNHTLYTYSFGNNGREVQANISALLVAQLIPNSFIVSMDSFGSDFISRGKVILKINFKSRLSITMLFY